MQNPQYRNTLTQNGQVFDLKTKDYMGKSIDFGKRRVFKDNIHFFFYRHSSWRCYFDHSYVCHERLQNRIN